MKGESSKEIEEQYQKIIAKADEYFSAENWPKAKNLYQRALKLKNYDQYPKDQLAEIEKILNPPKEVTSGYTLKDYGPPNRNTNSVDVEKLLEDSNEEKQNDANQLALKQREEAVEAENEDEVGQKEGIENTKDEIETYEYDNSVRVWSSEVKRTEYERDVEELGVDMSDRDRAWSKMNDNDSQHTKQSVTSLETEITADNYENDQPREEYLVDVETINIEIKTYNKLNENTQNSATGDSREYVEEYMEDNVANDPSMDIERKNTEVYVEDLNITLINANNEDSWNQEDEVIKVKDNTEILKDEQIAYHTGRDNDRIESLADVEDLTTELTNTGHTSADDQYDETMDVKNYTEDLTTEIINNNIGSDQDRLDTEEEVIDLNEELTVTQDHYTTDQNNELFGTDAKLDDFELEMEQDKKDLDKPRENYEEDVVDITTEIDDTREDLKQNGVNATNETKDLADDLVSDQNKFRLDADSKATDNQDATGDAVDDLIEKNNENLQQNDVAVEKAEDYLEELKYEDPSDFKTEGTNKLGEDFPEGVTEEIFTIEDANGDIESYIIRRIVVTNGYGNVYEKTKTRYGTETYTKNGAGISESVWQDETAAAELVRN